MSSNPWIQHVRAFAKERGLSYMCAATDPNCSKSYKEGKNTKTTTTTAKTLAPAPAKVVAPKTEIKSSYTNDNTFKEIDKKTMHQKVINHFMYINHSHRFYTKLLKLENRLVVLHITLLKCITEHRWNMLQIKIM